MAATQKRTDLMANPLVRLAVYAALAVALSVVHVVFLRLIAVSSVTPDLLLILTVWIALVEGQFAGMFFGFSSGLLFDAVSSAVLGTNALAKTIAAFVAGFFFKEGFTGRQIASSVRFLLIVGFSGLIHNLIYFFFYVRPMEISFWMFFVKYGLATTLYTTVIAVFPMLVANRRSE